MTLHSINSPDDLKKLSREELPALADELREFVLDSVSKNLYLEKYDLFFNFDSHNNSIIKI